VSSYSSLVCSSRLIQSTAWKPLIGLRYVLGRRYIPTVNTRIGNDKMTLSNSGKGHRDTISTAMQFRSTDISVITRDEWISFNSTYSSPPYIANSYLLSRCRCLRIGYIPYNHYIYLPCSWQRPNFDCSLWQIEAGNHKPWCKMASWVCPRELNAPKDINNRYY